MPSRIEDYALVGDCQTAALVGRDGSIDWLCWPRFDSGACFAALLGTPDHGRWLLAPQDVRSVSRTYRADTLILETEFETPEGEVTVIDFMPIRVTNSDLVRIVRGKRGRVRMNMELVIRFDYGRSVPWVTRMEDGALRAIAGPDMLVLRTTAPIRGENLKTVSEFEIGEGETVAFVLTYCASNQPLPEPLDCQRAFRATEKFWLEWVRNCRYSGPWKDAVVRSLITLKALTYAPTGGIIAAVTTSLPEKIGGQRNWDYRFCWLRDATFTLFALMNAGFYEEAVDWKNWLIRTVAGSPDQVQIMYGIAGERQLLEWDVPWLPGYEASSPVRVGNAAADQFQLDLYGEIAGVFHQSRKGHLPKFEPVIDLQEALLAHLESVWQRPDQGIWEMRGPAQNFTHSKVMVWLAFDRTIRSAEEFSLKGPIDRWKTVRQQIHDDICRNGFDRELNSFVQAYGSKELDASLLLIALTGFLPVQDPRVVGTVKAIERRLLRDGFVLRYQTEAVDDGLPPGEGVFLPCSFWLADNYILLRRFEEAKALIEKLLSLRNDIGLLAEEYDPVGRRQLGNFPQAFSHVSLVNSIVRLQRSLQPAAGPQEHRVSQFPEEHVVPGRRSS